MLPSLFTHSPKPKREKHRREQAAAPQARFQMLREDRVGNIKEPRGHRVMLHLVPGVAMAMAGQKTEEVCGRYAIVYEAMRRGATPKMNAGDLRGTTAHSTAHSKQRSADA